MASPFPRYPLRDGYGHKYEKAEEVFQAANIFAHHITRPMIINTLLHLLAFIKGYVGNFFLKLVALPVSSGILPIR